MKKKKEEKRFLRNPAPRRSGWPLTWPNAGRSWRQLDTTTWRAQDDHVKGAPGAGGIAHSLAPTATPRVPSSFGQTNNCPASAPTPPGSPTRSSTTRSRTRSSVNLSAFSFFPAWRAQRSTSF
ncbi:hypothetical protein NL676_006563 [Syzygium grande]|nr:hypothetical protein NL676_006563 [Syzygium grande]